MKKSMHRHVLRRRRKRAQLQAWIDWHERNKSRTRIEIIEYVLHQIELGNLRPVKTSRGGYLEKVTTQTPNQTTQSQMSST